jgi:hypothetical protein
LVAVTTCTHSICKVFQLATTPTNLVGQLARIKPHRPIWSANLAGQPWGDGERPTTRMNFNENLVVDVRLESGRMMVDP